MHRRWRKGLAVTALAVELAAAPSQTAYAGETGVITAMSEKVYLENNTDSTVLANILQGSSVEVILSVTDEAGGVWYYIRTDTGLEGYMPAQSMSITQQEEEIVAEQQPDNAVQEETPPENVAEEPAAEEPQQTAEEIETTQAEPETVTEETLQSVEEQSSVEQSATAEAISFEVSTQETKEQNSGFHLELFEIILAAGVVLCTVAIIFLIRKIKQMLMK